MRRLGYGLAVLIDLVIIVAAVYLHFTLMDKFTALEYKGLYEMYNSSSFDAWNQPFETQDFYYPILSNICILVAFAAVVRISLYTGKGFFVVAAILLPVIWGLGYLNISEFFVFNCMMFIPVGGFLGGIMQLRAGYACYEDGISAGTYIVSLIVSFLIPLICFAQWWLVLIAAVYLLLSMGGADPVKAIIVIFK